MDLDSFAFRIGASAKRTCLGLLSGLVSIVGRLDSFAFRVGVLAFQPIGLLSAIGFLKGSYRST